ncbi:calmodulin-dependent protein kinase [Gigaspora margarita]|uniref:Calmodulin-dependent protein kinase n=1 Tax=Gigaspora margarita TaxID=4874 RepID=A0A8H4AN99_GIGMA|nr:calmodulin-dependent protein kinase [Gigaspora margarita]
MISESLPSNYSNSLAKKLVANEIYDHQSQDTVNESQDLINEKIIDNLTKLHEEEVLKGNYDPEFLNSIEQYLTKNQLKPESLINLCLNNQNNSIILIILARCYRYGRWVEKDENKSFIYYQKSADMGNSYAVTDLGELYENGIGVDKDEKKAFFYFQIAANLDYSYGINKLEVGNAVGTYCVGYCYQNGIGVEKNERKSFIYYQKSADMGDDDGTLSVGYCYRLGIGVEKDENGIGVEKNESKAFSYYQKSAEMEIVDGIFMILNMGMGKDPNESSKLNGNESSVLQKIHELKLMIKASVFNSLLAMTFVRNSRACCR